LKQQHTAAFANLIYKRKVIKYMKIHLASLIIYAQHSALG